MEMDLSGFTCDATGCSRTAVHSYQEVHAVPAWRIPADWPFDQNLFEIGKTVYCCATHKGQAFRGHCEEARIRGMVSGVFAAAAPHIAAATIKSHREQESRRPEIRN